MVAACECHDPTVFSHDWYCELGQGPPGVPLYWARRHDFRPDPIMTIVTPPIPRFAERRMTASKNERRQMLEARLAILRRRRAAN